MSKWKSEWASTRVHDDTYACCDSFGRKGNRFAKIEYYNTAYIYSHTERMVDDERSIRKGSTRNFPLKIHKLSWHTYNENNNTAHAAALPLSLTYSPPPSTKTHSKSSIVAQAQCIHWIHGFVHAQRNCVMQTTACCTQASVCVCLSFNPFDWKITLCVCCVAWRRGWQGVCGGCLCMRYGVWCLFKNSYTVRYSHKKCASENAALCLVWLQTASPISMHNISCLFHFLQITSHRLCWQCLLSYREHVPAFLSLLSIHFRLFFYFTYHTFTWNVGTR